MKKIIITGVIVLATLAGIMYVLKNNKAKNDEATAIVAQKSEGVAVRTAKIEKQTANNAVVSNGTFAPLQDLSLSAETAGQVQKVLVKEGDKVNVGQTLAIIKSDKFNVAVSNAQAAYNNALADAQRFESAYASGGVTKQQLDQVKLQLENAKNNLASTKLNAGDAIIKATIPGFINSKSIEPGSFVSPGQGLFEIVNISALKLKITVDEKNVSTIKLGDKIAIESPVFPNDKFEGTITFIAPKADASLNFPVEIQVNDNADQKLRAGMYGNAIFVQNEETPILLVPRNAFVGSVSSNQVFVAKDGKAILKTVKAGRNFGDNIEIIDGLSEGDTVIVSGQINLTDNSPIQVIK